MKRIAVVLLIFCLLFCGCSPQKPLEKDKISVVTTIFPLYDFVRAIGGDRVDCRMLIDPGTEVHTFDPTPSDVRAVYNADLVVYIGGESDKWVESLLGEVNISVLSLMPTVKEHCKTEHTHHSHLHKHGADEHIWTSPENAVLMINKIAEVLSETDPHNAKFFVQNANSYSGKIRELSDEIKKETEKQKNPFILVADRFPFLYFAEEYGIEYEAAFGGCAVSTDISLKTMRRLVEKVRERKISYIYCTEMSSRNIANALSEETGVKILELHSAHNVTLDDFKSGLTYLDIMKNNITALKEGWED